MLKIMESLELGVVDEPYIKIKQKLAKFLDLYT
jgi:hypothetical protein